jgi:hypothetical protein
LEYVYGVRPRVARLEPWRTARAFGSDDDDDDARDDATRIAREASTGDDDDDDDDAGPSDRDGRRR